MNERWIHAQLVFLIVGQLLLLASQPGASGSPIERFFLALTAPVGETARQITTSITSLPDAWRTNRQLRAENETLEAKIRALNSEMVRLHGVEEELDHLAQLSEYSGLAGERAVADIVYIDRSSWLRTLVLHAGSMELRHNQPVVDLLGLVGRIIVTSGSYAKVQLVTDRSISVGAMIARTRRKGIIRGHDAEMLILDYIPLQADVRLGDKIVTAGTDGVFPRGIPIGEIVRIDPDSGLFHRILVEPAVDFGLLDQVYVLSQETLPPEVSEALARETP